MHVSVCMWTNRADNTCVTQHLYLKTKSSPVCLKASATSACLCMTLSIMWWKWARSNNKKQTSSWDNNKLEITVNKQCGYRYTKTYIYISCLPYSIRKYISTDYSIEDVPLVEFMSLIFPCMPGQSDRRWRGSLLYLCYIFRAISFFVPIINTPNSICSSKPVRHKRGILPANTPFPHFSNQLSKATTRIRTRSHSTFNKQCDFCCCCCCCCCCFLCGKNHWMSESTQGSRMAKCEHKPVLVAIG